MLTPHNSLDHWSRPALQRANARCRSALSWLTRAGPLQIGVFLYGCANGLAMLGLGTIVQWNDLIKGFERGAECCSSSLLSENAARAWRQPETVRAYYTLLAERTRDQSEGDDTNGTSANAKLGRAQEAVPGIQELDSSELQQYSKWTPFSEIWDVRRFLLVSGPGPPHACAARLLAAVLRGRCIFGLPSRSLAAACFGGSQQGLLDSAARACRAEHRARSSPRGLHHERRGAQSQVRDLSSAQEQARLLPLPRAVSCYAPCPPLTSTRIVQSGRTSQDRARHAGRTRSSLSSYPCASLRARSNRAWTLA